MQVRRTDGSAVPVTTRRSVVWHRIQPAELHARIREGTSLVVDAIDELPRPPPKAWNASCAPQCR
ncbi:hypothetical protein ADK93_16440 [Streptomyces sp. XY58]|nr:hypothetical protein ADK93_16440 [Streptomyces sp. XY58]KOV06271.1 hypothetical protein ADK89_15490 [Streptomyces sp. XY37]KOV43812.1 hypothetical protein ADK99_27880 [Streptomyces sp. MMG1064]